MNILVTGGAGFVGSHLVDAFINLGHRVRALDKLIPQVHENGRPQYLHVKSEFVQGDVCDASVIRKALEDIDVVYHLAAEVGVGQSMYEIQRYVHANTLGTSILLEAILEQRDHIKKLIVASSMSIYGEGAYKCSKCGVVSPQVRSVEQLKAHHWEMECSRCNLPLSPTATGEDKPLFPTSVYAVTKQDQEQLCLLIGRAYGIPTVALRYFNIYGARQALSNPYTGVCAIFSSRLLNNQCPIIFEDGQQTRDFVHVSDIVQANLQALETDRADYQSINVGTGIPTSVKAIARLLAEGLGKNLEPEIVGKFREGDIRHCVADISRAKNLLGYSPKITIRQGMNDLLGWVCKQVATDRVDQATAELKSRRLIR